MDVRYRPVVTPPSSAAEDRRVLYEMYSTVRREGSYMRRTRMVCRRGRGREGHGSVRWGEGW